MQYRLAGTCCVNYKQKRHAVFVYFIQSICIRHAVFVYFIQSICIRHAVFVYFIQSICIRHAVFVYFIQSICIRHAVFVYFIQSIFYNIKSRPYMVLILMRDNKYAVIVLLQQLKL